MGSITIFWFFSLKHLFDYSKGGKTKIYGSCFSIKFWKNYFVYKNYDTHFWEKKIVIDFLKKSNVHNTYLCDFDIVLLEKI